MTSNSRMADGRGGQPPGPAPSPELLDAEREWRATRARCEAEIGKSRARLARAVRADRERGVSRYRLMQDTQLNAPMIRRLEASDA